MNIRRRDQQAIDLVRQFLFSIRMNQLPSILRWARTPSGSELCGVSDSARSRPYVLRAAEGLRNRAPNFRSTYLEKK